jgi:hypothetical protein
MSTNSDKENSVVVFSDTTGRMIVGESVSCDAEYSKVKDPMVVQTQNREGQTAIGLVPYAHLELFDVESDNIWSFPNQTATWCENSPSDETVKLYHDVVQKWNEIRVKIKEHITQSTQPEEPQIVGENGNVIEFTD